MTQEHKDLLLKDLCARLPYGVKVICETEKSIFEVEAITSYSCVCPKDKNYLHNIDDDEIKPCLFPLSSMTWEQECQYREVIASSLNHYEVYDWLNKNHFDYRGLIPMDLAIDATNKDIY